MCEIRLNKESGVARLQKLFFKILTEGRCLLADWHMADKSKRLIQSNGRHEQSTKMGDKSMNFRTKTGVKSMDFMVKTGGHSN